MNIRHADEIRDFIRTNALPSFNPAIQWDESAAPFNIDEPIIYCRQEGRPVDAFVRQVSVTVYLFSGLNATIAELDQLYTDAVAALEYVKANFNVTGGIRATVTQDVMGEYRTGQNRRYYTFQVLCYSAEEI
jgi:hypothetical protein